MSTAAIPVHVALVDDTNTIDPDELAHVAAALSEQVAADFSPVWKVVASVGVYPKAPPGTWAIHLLDGLDEPGALGFHTDENHQPLARVDLTGGKGGSTPADDWPVTASHELLEMLADPWGNRLHAAAAPQGWPGDGPRVRYLVEVGDPCEATSYPVAGVNLSDFLLPAFYRSSAGPHTPVSHAGGVQHPLEIAPGGYISFMDQSGGWWQGFNEDGDVTFRKLGAARQDDGSLREYTDRCSREYRAGVAN